MVDRTDLQAFADDVGILLRKYNLKSEGFVVSITMHSKDFDVIASGHPDLVHPEMILKNGTIGDIQWGVQILRRRAREDYPPGTFLTPPPDG